MTDVLDRFSAPTRDWFRAAFATPTAAQALAWDAVSAGGDTLVVAPTGSGKTLAAFLWALDRLLTEQPPEQPAERCRVLYVSPLKALAVDVQRNLRAPLAGIRHAAGRLGTDLSEVQVGMRSGDTAPDERRRLRTHPPDILITTPESLFLMLTSRARETLRSVRTVIVDEVHAVAATKRGVHLALSLERLDALLAGHAQRIGLSATVRPVEEVARLLGGPREVTVVRPPTQKSVELSVVVPVADMADLADVPGPRPPVGGDGSDGSGPRQSLWPAIEERILDLVEQHRSTIVFANSRRLAERITARLNELAAERTLAARDRDVGSSADARASSVPAQLMGQSGAGSGAPPVVARAHHGSVSKEQRAQIEAELKSGRLAAVVATSSLELGIDMGAVDLVVQVESPPSVASGLQRVGRAGHQVGAVSRGVLFPKFRGDLVAAAVVAERMAAGDIEAMRYPRNPLDVLAQHVVSMVAMEPWPVADLAALVRRSAPFAQLPASALEAVLDMLAGRYPSDQFAELRPRLVWDRHADVLTGRPGAQRLAATSGGTIPDRGLFGVFLVGERAVRVGELDEEMVYESRAGDVFTLGSTSWRIEDITHDRVLVTPAPGVPGRLPFWKGDAVGRPVELGRAVGAFLRELPEAPADGAARLQRAGLDEHAVANLTAYLAEQREATGTLPDDRTLLVERFRDELGDWRLVVHSPFGARVHAPWALAIAARVRARTGVDAQAVHADDGIVLRLPDTDEPPDPDLLMVAADELEELLQAEVGGSALFASRFRECAARALLLPRRQPGRRAPLWQQRQRSAQLLSVAADYGSFPIVLETMRECLQDVFDVPGLVELLRQVERRQVRVALVDTATPSPFARSLMFGYVAAFMYEGDSPLAERRAAALTLDASMLSELLGRAELRELLDETALAEVESELQRLAPDRQARGVEGAADLLRVLGDLSEEEAAARGAAPADLHELEASRRAVRVRVARQERWVAVEDVGRLRDALGVPTPLGVAEAFVEPVADPLGDLVSRYARTRGPFRAEDLARRLGLGVAVATAALGRLAATGRLVQGEFRPGGSGTEWCDAEVLRLLRRRSLARLRRDIEPVPVSALVRFLPTWHGVGSSRGTDGLFRAVEMLQGAAVPASALESLVLPARVTDYAPAMLDALCSSGEVLWVGAGALPGPDGWVSLYLADGARQLLPPSGSTAPGAPTADDAPDGLAGRVLAALAGRALFFRDLSDHLRATDDAALLATLWELVWAGSVSNDTLAPLRALLGGARGNARAAASGRRGYGRAVLPRRSGPPAGAGRWSAVPRPEEEQTRRSYARTEVLLDRYGVLTRGAVAAEHVEGGFAATYRVLRAMEDAGRCRRGYFVETLGAAQFAVPGAVDRLRAEAKADEIEAEQPTWSGPAQQAGRDRPGRTLVLAATDPANPFGAALPWPAHPSNHRPGRKAGGVIVLSQGRLVLYVERGGRSLLSFTDAPELLQPSVDALALAVRDGALGRLTVTRADGVDVVGPGGSALTAALEAAGFRHTPRGLRLRR